MYRRLPTILILSVSLLRAIQAMASPFTIDGSTVHVNAGLVGIRTSTPITVLDVNGDAQFGSGATKSTFTATGLLKLTSSGIQWADGTTSTTAVSGGGGGGANLSSTQTWTGTNVWTSTTIFGSSSQFADQAMPSVYARSFDGATQSSGCVVVISFGAVGGGGASSGNANARMVFTSTTTTAIGIESGSIGVLMETCAPGSDCRVAVAGPVRARARSACSGTMGYQIQTWSTRCESNCGSASGPQGQALNDDWSSGWAWFWLR